MSAGGTNKLLLLAIAVLWAAALASAAGAIYSKHRARELFVELERLNVRRDNLEIEWGQLQLEQSAWSTHAFVENVAGAKPRRALPPPEEARRSARAASARVARPPPKDVELGSPARPRHESRAGHAARPALTRRAGRRLTA